MTETILHLTDLEKQFVAMTDIEYWDGDDCAAALDDYKVDYSSRRWKGVASSLCKKGIIFKDEDRGLWIDPEFVYLWGYEDCADFNAKLDAKFESKPEAKKEPEAEAKNDDVRWGIYVEGVCSSTVLYRPDTKLGGDGSINEFISEFPKNDFTVYGLDEAIERIDGAALTEDRIITEVGDCKTVVVVPKK